MSPTRTWLARRYPNVEERRAYEAAMNRRYRAWHPEDVATQRRWNDRRPERMRAHKAVYWAVKAGALVRPDRCEVCGREGKPQACHWDYARQLDVLWLCRPCHRHMDTQVLKVGSDG